jgi:hypothetical protein
MPSYIKDYSTRALDWLDIDDPIWGRLSNFWTLTPNRGYVTVGWKAWMDLKPTLTEYMQKYGFEYAIEAPKYTDPDFYPMPIELCFDSTSETGNPDEYYVDAELRSLGVLQDFLVEPGVVLTDGDGSFTFTTPITSNAAAGRGVITFAPATNYPTKMWLTSYTFKFTDELVDRFGQFVNYSYRNKLELYTKADIRALLRAQEFGPFIPHLASVICIINEWPYSPVDGTISSINSTQLTILSSGDASELYVVDDTTSLGFMHKVNGVWVPVVHGDTVLALEPLTEAVDIIDLQIDPHWWMFLPVGWAEKWHTFLVKFNPDLPYDTTSGDGTNVDHYAFMSNSTLWMEMIDRHKSIGSKPYYSILWDWQPDGHVIMAPDIMYESFETGIISSAFYIPSGVTTGINTEFGVIPMLTMPAGIFKDGEFVASMTSFVYNTESGAIPLAPTVGVYASA